MLTSCCPRQLHYICRAEFQKVKKISLKRLRAIGYDKHFQRCLNPTEILLNLCKIVYPDRTGNFIISVLNLSKAS